jgi:hypothetical protein
MSVIDDLKNQWNEGNHTPSVLPTYDRSALAGIARTRARHQVSRAMHYFWGALTLQIIVYALFSHVWIRSWGEPRNQWLCLAGILLYLPFTVMLLTKFKQIALASPGRKEPDDSVQKRIEYQYLNLVSFYQFKKRYEYVLIPASTALCIVLLFQLYVPGGLEQHITPAIWLFVLTLLSCGWAIRRENRNQFERPIEGLRELLSEFDQ